MNRQRLDTWCEWSLLGLILAILASGSLALGAVRTSDFLVIQALTAVAVLIALLRLWLHPGERLLWPPICWSVLAFVAYAIARTLTADLPYPAHTELARIVVYALIFLIVLNHLTRQEFNQITAFVLIFLAMAIAMYGVYQFATHSDRVWHLLRPSSYLNRGSGTFINPNHFSGFLEMALPLGLAFALIGRVNPVSRVLLVYASLAMLAGIGASLSRGGWIATGGSFILFFAILLRRRQYRIPGLILFALLVTAAVMFYKRSEQSRERIEQSFRLGTSDDTHGRLWLWEASVNMWKDHPWTGVGPGHFDQVFPAYRPPAIQSRPGYTHNDYLNCLVDWGVVGFLIVASAWILLFFGVLRTWKYVGRDSSVLGSKPSGRAAFLLGATASLVAILIHSLFDFNLQVPANALVVVTLMALVSGHLRFASDRYWIRVGIPGRVVLTGLALAAVGYLALEGWKRHQEDLLLAAARKETVPLNRIEALKRAAAAAPANYEIPYAIGESLRAISWLGDEGYQDLAREAIDWFERGARLNPYDAYSPMRIGMCLDWLGRREEAAPYYEQSLRLDPNNYYLQAHQGWHYVQTEEWAKARESFDRSYKLKWWDNPIAANYRAIVERKLQEQAAQPSSSDNPAQ